MIHDKYVILMLDNTTRSMTHVISQFPSCEEMEAYFRDLPNLAWYNRRLDEGYSFICAVLDEIAAR